MSATSYHHGRLREALIDAAIEVAREQGPAGVSLRDLARRVGVSHNAAYRHFADRDALIEAVAERGIAALLTSMQRRLEAVDEPDPPLRARLRLAEVGRGYVEFAVAEPGLFRLTFSAYPDLPSPDDALSDYPRPGQEGADHEDPFGLLSQMLDELVATGAMPVEQRPGAEIACWSAVHGFSVLHLDGPLRSATPREREEALDAVLTSIDRSYGAPGAPRLFAAER